MENWTFDRINDDLCHGCKFAVLKQEGTYGMFGRRFGCTCEERIQDLQNDAIQAIKDKYFGVAIAICSELGKHQTSQDRYGWFEPDDNCVLCAWKEELQRNEQEPKGK